MVIKGASSQGSTGGANTQITGSSLAEHKRPFDFSPQAELEFWFVENMGYREPVLQPSFPFRFLQSKS